MDAVSRKKFLIIKQNFKKPQSLKTQKYRTFYDAEMNKTKTFNLIHFSGF